MLPSMPLLFSSSRDSLIGEGNRKDLLVEKGQDIESSEKEKKIDVKMCISNEIPDFTFESIPEDEKECDDELVLMAENSRFGEKRRLHAHTTVPRKKRRVDPVETFLEDRNSNDEQANHFAMAYFMKAKGELDELTFQKFIAFLSELDEESVDGDSLYKEVCGLLQAYPQLAHEFLGFLHPYQALQAGNLTDFLHFEQSWHFFRKLDGFHMNKVNHLLEQHSLNPLITSEGVRSSLLAAFKGHPTIAEGFLQLLPGAKPAQSCREDYEDISELGGEDPSWERLSFTDSLTSSCLPNECDCCCHSSPTKKFCTFCNVKFSKGQIYVRTGKGLRFAKVTFRGYDQEEILWRLHPTFYNKPVSRKRTKSSSHQNKESSGNEQAQKRDTVSLEVNKDSEKGLAEGEKDGVELEAMGEEEEILFLESQLNVDMNPEEGTGSEDVFDSDKPRLLELDASVPDTSTNSLQIDNQPVHQANNENNILPEETVVKNYLGEHERNSGCSDVTSGNDSLNIFPIEESDKSKSRVETDACEKEVKREGEEEMCKSFLVEVTSEQKEETKVWTREEDKLILQAFQHEHGNEQTFSKISNLLPSRSIEDIQGRFQVLMNFLEQMTNGCYESSAS